MSFLADEIVKLAQGPAALADSVALDKDAKGFTHPNLHRRIDPQQPPTDSGYSLVPIRSEYATSEEHEAALKHYHETYSETAPRDYSLTVAGLNSYRTTAIHSRLEDVGVAPVRSDYSTDEEFFAAMDEYLRLHEVP